MRIPLMLGGSLLTVAVIFGGGGAPAPSPDLAVELFALFAFGVWLMLRNYEADAPRFDKPMVLLWGAFAVIPGLQLVPLPPAIWSSLPGRGIVVEAANLAGKPDAWLPLSLAPYRTLASLIGLIPPITLFCMALRMSAEMRIKLLLVLVALTMLSALIGVMQVVSGGTLVNFYPTHIGYAVGFQANRNSAADLWLVGLCALASCAWRFRDRLVELPARAAAFAAALVLALLVVLSGSRAGTVLLTIPALVGAGLFLPNLSIRRGLAIIGVASALAAVIALSAPAVPMLERTTERFGNVAGEGRPDIWQDAAFAAWQVAPVGSGVGTIVPLMIAHERLEVVDTSWPNRAHNDYLEFALEAGAVGVALIITIVIALFGRISQLLRRSRSGAETAGLAFAIGTAAIVLVHSAVDYPLRSLSLATVAALATSFLSSTRRPASFYERRINSKES